jgi:hypothetical protein
VLCSLYVITSFLSVFSLRLLPWQPTGMTSDFGSEEEAAWSDQAVPRRNCAAGRRGEGEIDGIKLWSRGQAIGRRSKGRALPISSCRSPLSFSLLSPSLRRRPPFLPAPGGTGMQGPGQRGPLRGAATLLLSLRLRSFSWRRTGMWEYGCRSTCRRAWLWFCRQNTRGQNHGWRCPYGVFNDRDYYINQTSSKN